MKKLIIGGLFLIILSGLYLAVHDRKNTEVITNKTAAFNRQLYSISDNSSPWVIINKQRPFKPLTFEPNDLITPATALQPNISQTEKLLRRDTAAALHQLISQAEQQGIRLNLQSGYRSYYFQNNLYKRYVVEQGQSAADTASARPGYSEHQTGLAADIGSPDTVRCNVEQCFATTKQGAWLASNAYKYGFIIRYPAGKKQVTGYVFEPWHIRYVGDYLARAMKATSGSTLESFFNLSSAADY